MSSEETKESALKSPCTTLTDILADAKLEKQRLKNYGKVGIGNYTMPDMIVSDWMYLGNRIHAANSNVIKKLSITHILNCSEAIPCFHISSRKIKYARVALQDTSSSNLYDYMKAASCFIDECNPYYSPLNTKKKNKILIHCAAGVSRSASIVLSYLINRHIEWNDIEKGCIDIIRQELEYKIDMNYKSLTLSEAYYFGKSCRSWIQPNPGFLKQLEKFEMSHHNGISTKSDIHFHSGDKQEMFEKIASNRQYLTNSINAKKGTTHSDKFCNCIIL